MRHNQFRFGIPSGPLVSPKGLMHLNDVIFVQSIEVESSTLQNRI